MKRSGLKRSGPSKHGSDKSMHERSQTLSDTEESVQPRRKKVRWERNPESVTAAITTEKCSSEEDANASKVNIVNVRVFCEADHFVRYA